MSVEPSYRLGGEMAASITVRNIGRMPVELPVNMTPHLHWLDLVVLGPDGEQVEWWARAGKVEWEEKRPYQPGEAETTVVKLNFLFSIRRPGTYRVKAIFGRPPLPDVRPYATVESDFYRFDVLP